VRLTRSAGKKCGKVLLKEKGEHNETR
jgi:hypothetical protein